MIVLEDTLVPCIQITRAVMKQIAHYFAGQSLERGCLIGSSRYLNRIDHVVPVPGSGDRNKFTPDMDAVNGRIAAWRERGICFCGFIHSHPGGPACLSCADCDAIESWVRAAGLPFLCFALADEAGALTLYLAEKQSDDRIAIHPMQRRRPIGFSRYLTWRVVHE